jgi:hypothetical protein
MWRKRAPTVGTRAHTLLGSQTALDGTQLPQRGAIEWAGNLIADHLNPWSREPVYH